MGSAVSPKLLPHPGCPKVLGEWWGWETGSSLTSPPSRLSWTRDQDHSLWQRAGASKEQNWGKKDFSCPVPLGASGGRGNSGAFVPGHRESGPAASPGSGWALCRQVLFEVTLSKLSLSPWEERTGAEHGDDRPTAKDGNRPGAGPFGWEGWWEVCGPEECGQTGGTCGSHVEGQPLQGLGRQVGVN